MVRWAYGVTTVRERFDDLLPTTLASLARAGFDRPRLFVDGEPEGHRQPGRPACAGPELPQEAGHLPCTFRSPRLRTFGNWVLGLAELYIREPAADRYAMFQDDFVACRGLREYLERWCPERGYQNLFTMESNWKTVFDEGRSGAEGWRESNQLGRGAVALVFGREAVKALLGSAHMIARPEDSHRGWRSIDGGIVAAMNKAGYREWVHAPSLVQHTGKFSSMDNKPHRPSPCWPGEEFDARSLGGGSAVTGECSTS